MQRVKTYHKDIGFPGGIEQPPKGLRLTYSLHARTAATQDGLKDTDLPARLPRCELIEATTDLGTTVKWVVRMPLPGQNRDLVLVVKTDGFVKTAWVNYTLDTHKTLRRDQYTDPNPFQRTSK